MQNAHEKFKRGQLSIQILLFSAIAVILISAFSFATLSFFKSSVRVFNKTLAFSVAEAGIEYYRWHLAHYPGDFEDGTGAPGPYTHDYYDKNGTRIGEFILDITPPPPGTTVVTVRSTGKVLADSSVEKIIEVRLGIPSLAAFAVIGDEGLYFGSSTTVYGKLHANGGIRFDGIAYNLMTSAQAQYDDWTHGGGVEFGVHTHALPVDPVPPNPVPNRTDVFVAGRQFPVPAVDFDGITGDLADIKALAQSGGRYVASSTTHLGYHIVLKADDTFDLFMIDEIKKKPPGCNDIIGQQGWGTWSIEQEHLVANYAFPANGLIFVEDNVWVDGTIDGARLTLAAGVFPENFLTYKNITVNRNLLYTRYDGSDAIGLISQNDVTVGLLSDDVLRIDAAVTAQNGRFGRYYYRPGGSQGQGGCQPYHVRAAITTYGMIATSKDIQFSYGDNTGYLSRTFIYDTNLLFNPPPNFPPAGNEYEQLSWDEVK